MVLQVEDERVERPRTLTAADEEALFREARRLRRQRWIRRSIALGAVVGVSAGAVALATSPSGHPGSASRALNAGVLPNGAFASLRLAGPLAVAPDGVLYVTNGGGPAVEPFGDQILVRLPDGRFRVVAGTGKAGFSGDGGPAVRAELSSVSDLVFAPNGTLYLADGGRVRTISPGGVIRTIAGNGQPPRTIRNGTPAFSAPLGTPSTDALRIALSPTGQLYISNVRQLLRLTSKGTLETVHATASHSALPGPLSNATSIAIDSHGNIDVADPWSIWQIAPSGIAHYVGFDRGAGGTFPVLQRGPGGAVYAEDGGSIMRIKARKLVALADWPVPTLEQFLTIGFALGLNGTIYADDIPGVISTGAHQQLIAVNNHHATVLWQSR
jgi:hypothetical protein